MLREAVAEIISALSGCFQHRRTAAPDPKRTCGSIESGQLSIWRTDKYDLANCGLQWAVRDQRLAGYEFDQVLTTTATVA